MFKFELRYAISTLLGFFLLTFLSAYAVQAQQTPTLNSRVANIESTVFGTPRENTSLLDRIDGIEKKLYGARQKGGIEARVQNLEHTMFGPESTPAQPGLSSTTTDKANLDSDSTRIAAPDFAGSSAAHASLLSGVAAVQRGDDTQARGFFQQALVLDPTNADAVFNLGALSEKSGDINQALAYYREAAQDKPGDPEITQVVNSLQSRLAYNQVMPTPFREKKPFGLSASTNQSTVSLAPMTAPVATVGLPKGGTAHKAKGLLHKIGQVAKVGAVTAAVVLANSAVTYGNVDTCACP